MMPSPDKGRSNTSMHGKSRSSSGRSPTSSSRIVSIPSRSTKATTNSRSVSGLPAIRSSISPEKHQNPFKVPDDHDILNLRDKEKKEKLAERERQKKLRVDQKTTYTSRINARTKQMIKPAGDTDDDLSDEDTKSRSGNNNSLVMKEDADFVLSTTKDRHIEKENLAEFVSKKREMFLVQFSLGVKRDEMGKLEETAQSEEKKLELAEQYLEEDAAMFDEFLKDNDKNAVEAIKIAETETKSKMERVAEIKKINAQIMSIKSEISRNEDILKEYTVYKQFLDDLAPNEWRERISDKQAEKKMIMRLQKEKEKQTLKEVASVTHPRRKLSSVMSMERNLSRNNMRRRDSRTKYTTNTGRRRSSVSYDTDSETQSVISTHDNHTDEEDTDDDEAELYFDDPMQLLDLFSELEEQNLSLIQNSQETEETLEEMRKTVKETKSKMSHETEALSQQLEKMQEAITREEAKAEELEMTAKMFSYGEFKSEDQEKMLAQLNKKVEEVYRNCIGDNEANISTLQMLTNIENRLEELFEMIESMPQDKVELAEKAKEKERRLRLREEKLTAQKLHQEERVKKALERARAEPKKKVGRPLAFRSAPPQMRKRENAQADDQDREDEELKAFFTMN